MPKYITDQEYCRAKNRAGNVPLWRVYPMEERKLFPFHIHTNFYGSVSKYGFKRPVRQKMIEPMNCGVCDEPLNDDYGYYTAFIVFDSATEFYACCYDCLPDNSLEYEHQRFGYRHPMTLGPYASSQKHRAVVYAGFSHSSLFDAWNYKTVTADQLKNELGVDGEGGGSFDGGFLDYKGLRIKILDTNWKLIAEIKPKETVQLANEIIAWNHANNPNNIVVPPEGIQLQIF